MHGITHATAVKMFSELPQSEQAQAQEGFARYVLGLAPRMKILELHPDQTAAVLELLRAEVGNVRGLVQLFNSRDTLTKLRTAEWGACVTDLSDRLYAREMLFDTESLRRLALTIFEEALGPKHYETATALDNLGTVLVGRGEPWATDGVPFFRRAATSREEALGALHEHTVLSRFKLAHTLRDLGKPAEAEPVYRRALAVAEQMAGPKSMDVAVTLDNLATALQVLGRYAEAEPLYRRALAISEEVLGPRDLTTALFINNVGAVVGCLGEVAEAERLHRRALEIREAVGGPKHPDTAMSLFNVGYILNAQGKEAPAAAALLERALEVYTEVLGKKHPQTIKARQQLRKAQGRQYSLQSIAAAKNDNILRGDDTAMETLLAAFAVLASQRALPKPGWSLCRGLHYQVKPIVRFHLEGKWPSITVAHVLARKQVVHVELKNSWQEKEAGDIHMADMLKRVKSVSECNMSRNVFARIGDFTGLTVLDLSHFSVRNTPHLPEAICNIMGLETLRLKDWAAITRLPDSIVELQRLRTLDLGRASSNFKR
ncbi:hypothetical protein JKP88DRAFT_353297 [Tribonema minus]|uniref:Tetratricopeptide repeat protein n=1 Tax=Tribonema minus TaxID=303371 RepID=A0A835ZCG3_9STRA|nr:hypothetical protein JKP88DRAFT_353297 [Tribonema minus]